MTQHTASMHQIVATTMSLLAMLALQPALSAAQCSAVKHNCNVTKCCIDKSLVCFEKNKEFADCRTTCAPGIHDDDGKSWRTEWSCKQLSAGCAAAFQPCGGTTGATCCNGCKCNGACQPPLNEHSCAAGVKLVKLFFTITDTHTE